MRLNSETLIVDDRPSYPYRVMGNRYIPAKKTTIPPKSSESEHHVSLVLLHATGMYKEVFEPVIEVLFAEYPSRKTDSGCLVVIDEVWSIDCPNHGQSAALNRADIERASPSAWTIREYANAAHTFLRSKPGGHDLSKRQLVLVGHSVGGSSILFMSQLMPQFNVHAIVLADNLSSPPCPKRKLAVSLFIKAALCRPEVWQSSAQATNFLERDRSMGVWPARARQSFLKFAIRDPIDEPGNSNASVCLKLACPREHEASIYRSVEDNGEEHDALHALLGSGIPVHYIYDQDPPTLTAFFRESTLSCRGRRPTTAHPAKGGHMFVITEPAETARLIAQAIGHETSSNALDATARL
ncbi:hypothetical protein SISNIDRAFT_303816 [Sistotremastrum niveocremeum HHB9708]|uniref:AB hydrolase-1 domain-containing protein n=2 Tax=Sistotremastraceae TaxID=3402574 RepID=A0A164N4T8_9AGAM|nr:hypothetical protein SISNIDRAFT_303816 [Sistotremastrum niveocremeum HHB9708]KZT39882.1 hypothetical protein SISSUDRAFT_572761 [Sistotremastrum suecicum HHB10207 ss-3]